MTNKKTSVGDYRGISVNGRTAGHRSRNLRPRRHRSRCSDSDRRNAPGITFQSGWDASKRTGGIVFDVQAGTGTAVKTKFNDVLVEDNVVQDCSFGGIIFKQLDGSVHWGTRGSAVQHDLGAAHQRRRARKLSLPARHQLRLQRQTYVSRVPQRPERSGADATAARPSSIDYSRRRDLRDQGEGGRRRLERHGHRKATTKTVIQYNYFHDNGDGISASSHSATPSSATTSFRTTAGSDYLHSDAAGRAPSTTTRSTTTRPTPASLTGTVPRSTRRTPSRTTSSTRRPATAC